MRQFQSNEPVGAGFLPVVSRGKAVERRIGTVFFAGGKGLGRQGSGVFQIIFNEISAAEISQLPTMMQMEVLSEFQVTPEDLEDLDGDRFGSLEREGKKLYRYRAKDVRIYFEVTDDHSVLVHRVLTKNTFQDFLYRTKLPLSEDEELSQSKQFWKLIEEGENAQRL